MTKISYAQAILDAHHYLLEKYRDVFVIGQGVWSPWYVGTTMDDLDKVFGHERIIDSPVSELATTGVGIGASLCNYRAIVVHPRVDFLILAIDQIVNQAAKWSHMFGGQARVPVTFRGIVNRGGEQGAQHSQALHAWFAHVPGLRVVMPATAADARDLLVASVLSDDPVLYIDDRWLYENEQEVPAVEEMDIAEQRPLVLRKGEDITLVGSGYSTDLALRTAAHLQPRGISCEVVDLRVVNPLDYAAIVASVVKTGRLCAIDGGWRNCGLAGEIIAGVCERIDLRLLKNAPMRFTLPDAPAPTSKVLEDIYYPQPEYIAGKIEEVFF